jgi:V/A-type H+-transporting ATPase subunit I
MSRVSVTGSKRVMDEAVETVHRMDLLHVTDYDGGWEGFRPGEPREGADEASEKLVTVRSLESILDVEGEEAGPRRIVSEEELDEELERVRTEVNELDDRRDELEDELRDVEETIDRLEPLAELGIDLDLLGGYDSVEVSVGRGDPEAVRRALVDAGVVDHQLFTGDDDRVLAVAARTAEDRSLEDLLVGAAFEAIEVPEGGGGEATDPSARIAELEGERERLEERLADVEEEIAAAREEYGGFLLAAEETLTIETQRREAPLSFATTANAFVAEGWIPTDRFVDLAEGLYDAVGDHVEVDELERARYDGEGAVVSREEVGGDTPGRPEPTAADGGAEARTDGGATVTERTDGGGEQAMADSDPPVVQDNPGIVTPFETLTRVVNRPRYSELDPTVILALTFPIFFGFMIGDVGYGVVYSLIGYYLYANYEGALQHLGTVGLLAGLSTIFFGFLYGEIFGTELIARFVWPGHPFRKGIRPAFVDFALLWLVVSIMLGLAHVTVGYAFGFVQELTHGFKDAFLEKGSWVIMMFGLWIFIFSDTVTTAKPDFLFTVLNGSPMPLGFGGFPAALGWAGLVAFVVGLVMIYIADPVEFIEAVFLKVFVDGLSYTRLAAVLLAKAGMAFTVNLIVFGIYDQEEFKFISTHGGLSGVPAEKVIFPGLFNLGDGVVFVIGLIAGIVVLVLGHAVVLALGITSAGLQAIRLEYVEFFQKFFEGGGEEYRPFGYERRYTSEE